jgi:hypothetical protein
MEELVIFAAPMRAREARAPAGRGASAAAAPSSPTGSSRLDGAAAADHVADFHFSDIAVRGDDGARAIGANEPRGRRRQQP